MTPDICQKHFAPLSLIRVEGAGGDSIEGYCNICVNERFGARIRAKREALGLTVQELADAVPVSRNNLYIIESGTYQTSNGNARAHDVYWTLLDLEDGAAPADPPVKSRRHYRALWSRAYGDRIPRGDKAAARAVFEARYPKP